MSEKFITLRLLVSILLLAEGFSLGVAMADEEKKPTSDATTKTNVVSTMRTSKGPEATATTSQSELKGLNQSAAGLENPQWQTYPTLTEKSKYGDNFTHYDYVNPNAPKGGTLNMIVVGTFDTLNPYIVEGSPPEGMVPLFGGLLYDTLMNQSLDQGGVLYPNIALAMRYPKDCSWAEFKLNPKARFHDGTPITVEDIIWSFDKLNKISPYYRGYYSMVDHAEKVSDDTVRFVFKIKGDREMPICMGDLVILPKHWWEGKDKNGKQRDITRPTLEIPLGSGAYKIESFVPGKEIVWTRVKDYWAKDLPTSAGRFNYDKIKYSYMRDENAQWEAFKKGGMADYREEKLIQRWVREYDFAKVQSGDVKKIAYENIYKYSPGFFFNTRREKFQDRRVRKALFLALDFDTMNRDLFFNKYTRLLQYFNYPVFDCSEPPKGLEREILERVRGKVPDEVFTKGISGPSYATPQDARNNLTEAMRLLREAGYHLEKGKLVDKNGSPFSIEILLSDHLNEQFSAFYVASLRRLGIDARLRTVDLAQYVTRRSSFDYDIIYEDVPESVSPGNEQLDHFGSHFLHINGSLNYSGVNDPAVDQIIEDLIRAKDRAGVVACAKALDRVLFWNYYRAPCWKSKVINIAYWKKMGFPPTQPGYKGFDFLSGWINPEAQNGSKNPSVSPKN